MSAVQLQLADWLYVAAATARIDRHSVAHPVVNRFSARLVELYRSLGEDEAVDPFWSEVLRQLFVARMSLFALPLPFDHSGLIPTGAIPFLRSGVDRCQHSYPVRTPALNELVNLLERLRHLDANPLLGLIEAHMKPMARAAVLVRSGRYVPPLASYLADTPLQHLEVLTVSRLRDMPGLDQLFIVGPSAWFPAFVVTAPRARELHLLHYSCVRDDFMPAPVFQRLPGSRPPRLLTIREHRSTAIPDEEMVTARELSEAALWVLPTDQMATSTGEEAVRARLVLLDGGCAVFLEEGSLVLAIDLEAGENSLERPRVEEVVPGQFLLLRTERGGDYVETVADTLMGEDALTFRRLQRAWKARLREKVEASGLFEVSIELLELGSICADETNVRNWCSFRSIKTHDRRDFAAIMKLIGWTDREAEVWDTMEVIASAHRRAGNRIRQQLLDQVRRADLSVLEDAGRMEFALPEAEGGSFTAFRVEDRLPEVISVSINRLGQPFYPEGRPWHG